MNGGACDAGDMADAIQRLAFERVLRNVLSFPSHPAVVVFMTMMPGTTFRSQNENDMLVIAQHYQVPVLSTRCVAMRRMLVIAQHC